MAHVIKYFTGNLPSTILLFFLFISGVVSFDLYNKSVYLLGGASGYNIGTVIPFEQGYEGTPGSRVGNFAWQARTTGKLHLFGGILSQTVVNYRNDIWRQDESRWIMVRGTSFGRNDQGSYTARGAIGVPANREGACSWLDNAGNMWLFGGNSMLPSNVAVPTNDLWRYNLNTDVWVWISGNTNAQYNLTCQGCPSGRYRAGHWSHGNKLYIFGGVVADGTATNDVWMFDVDAGNWTLVVAARAGAYQVPNGHPPARSSPAIAADATSAWIIGGRTSDNNFMSDIWKFNSADATWNWVGGSTAVNSAGTYPSTLGTAGEPSARDGACAWFDLEGTLWMYGGYRDLNNQTTKFYYGDFWRMDITASTPAFAWAGTSAVLEFPAYNMTGGPGPRAYASCWRSTGGDMYFFGGTTANGTRNDWWVIDMNECTINNGGCSVGCVNKLAEPYSCLPCPNGTIGDGHSECLFVEVCSKDNGGCDNRTTCTNDGYGGVICGPCPPGYNGTGASGCIDFDECSVEPPPCDPLVTCTPGTLDAKPTCGPCPPKYNGTGDTQCVDIDECATNNGGCDPHMVCKNKPGADAECGPCHPYWTLATVDGRELCVDIKECAVNNGGCSQYAKCNEVIGGPPLCGECFPHYTGNGIICQDVNECEDGANGGCPEQTMCINNPGAPPTCGPCQSGFLGNSWCTDKSKSSNAGLIAGVTIGGFIILLSVIGMIFYFTKDKYKKTPSQTRLSSPETANKFELTALSKA